VPLIARRYNYHSGYRIVMPSGAIRWLCSQGVLMTRDDHAGPGRMIGKDLRDQAEALEFPVREADHRIKNSLQLVISLLTVQLRGAVAQPRSSPARKPCRGECSGL
jgi:hypothetical protein